MQKKTDYKQYRFYLLACALLIPDYQAQGFGFLFACFVWVFVVVFWFCFLMISHRIVQTKLGKSNLAVIQAHNHLQEIDSFPLITLFCLGFKMRNTIIITLQAPDQE